MFRFSLDDPEKERALNLRFARFTLANVRKQRLHLTLLYS